MIQGSNGPNLGTHKTVLPPCAIFKTKVGGAWISAKKILAADWLAS